MTMIPWAERSVWPVKAVSWDWRREPGWEPQLTLSEGPWEAMEVLKQGTTSQTFDSEAAP